MQLSDRAIILSVRKFGEYDAVIHLLTAEHGLYAGVSRAAFSKAQRGVFQPGNIVEMEWKARLSEHLGSLRCDAVESIAALLLDDALRLSCLNAACALLEKLLSEREPQTMIYQDVERLMLSLKRGGDWLRRYIQLELDLLRISGFGLDLACCAATGSQEDLTYVSPKSGRAVSRDAGRPYHEKMLPLPAFLLERKESHMVTRAEAMDGLALTGFFLESRVFGPHGMPMPKARARFVSMLQRQLGPVSYRNVQPVG